VTALAIPRPVSAPPLPHDTAILLRLHVIAKTILASRHEGPCQVEDLVAAGWLGFRDAWERGVAANAKYLKTFAFRRAEGAMLDEIRRWNGVPWYPVQHPVHLDQLEDGDWETLSVDGPDTDVLPFVMPPALRDRLDEALRTLTRREREAVQYSFFEDLPMIDVSEKMGISISVAYLYRWAAVQKLRKYFTAEPVDEQEKG